MRKCTQKYTKMHIDILNLLRTAHTFSAMYVNIHTVHTVQTYILCLCVCVRVCVNSLVFKNSTFSRVRFPTSKSQILHLAPVSSAREPRQKDREDDVVSWVEHGRFSVFPSLYKAVCPAAELRPVSQSVKSPWLLVTRQVELFPRFQWTPRRTPS